MSNLLSSYADIHKRIKTTGCVWVQAPNGKWYHSFNKTRVKNTLRSLTNAMWALTEKYAEERKK